jgi:tryptophan-rich sensory protein
MKLYMIIGTHSYQTWKAFGEEYDKVRMYLFVACLCLNI